MPKDTRKEEQLNKRKETYHMWYKQKSISVEIDNSDTTGECIYHDGNSTTTVVFAKAGGNNDKIHTSMGGVDTYTSTGYTKEDIESLKKFSCLLGDLKDEIKVFDNELSNNNSAWLLNKVNADNPFEFIDKAFESVEIQVYSDDEDYPELTRYWDEKGEFKDLLKEVNKKIPSSGSCKKFPRAELLRVVNLIYYDYYNNSDCQNDKFDVFAKQFRKQFDEMDVLSYVGIDEVLKYFEAMIEYVEYYENVSDEQRSSIYYNYTREKGVYKYESMLEQLMSMAILVANK